MTTGGIIALRDLYIKTRILVSFSHPDDTKETVVKLDAAIDEAITLANEDWQRTCDTYKLQSFLNDEWTLFWP